MSDTEALLRRIEALEAEVHRLRSGPDLAVTQADSAAEPLSRRRLLRGAGMAVAGAAGALASPALTGQAAAADTDPAVLGATNTAASQTVITRTAGATATLRLTNQGTGAPLNVANPFPDDLDEGDVFFSEGFLGVGASGGPSLVYESTFATFPVLGSPFRILDTRFASASASGFGRTRVTNPSGKFDAAGRLRKGQSINLRLDDFSYLALGIIANFTSTGSLGGGYLRVWPTGATAPAASILNYAAGQNVANAATVALGFDTSDRDSLTIDAQQGDTHVIVDISGLVVTDPFNNAYSLGLSSVDVAADEPTPMLGRRSRGQGRR